MFNVIVSFGTQSQWQFMFKDLVSTREPLDKFRNGEEFIYIEDHFGNEAIIVAKNITGILIEDYTTSADASIERHMTQARAQAKAQSKINADPVLRMVAPMNGPMPAGMMRS